MALARGERDVVERARALLGERFDWMGRLVGGIVFTDAAALRGDPEEAVARMRDSVTALSDGSGRLPDVTVRLAAVADRAAGLRGTGGEDRWTDLAGELVESARGSAVRHGPEGQAWLARAEAEWTRAVSGPDAAAWEKKVAAFANGDVYELARVRLGYAEALSADGRPCGGPGAGAGGAGDGRGPACRALAGAAGHAADPVRGGPGDPALRP